MKIVVVGFTDFFIRKCFSMKIIKGDLVELAKDFQFDVIGHSCNCFCRMGRGIAPQLALAFGCDNFLLEQPKYVGDYNKLGQIDYGVHTRSATLKENRKKLIVVNCYSQYHWKQPGKYGIPCDYDALRLCMRKINFEFQGLTLGLPYLISAGLACGDEGKILKILEEELIDMTVTLVHRELGIAS